MTCPRCGGSIRDLLAPGFYRCRSVVATHTGGPGLTDPSLGPPVITTETVCGHEYQPDAAFDAAGTRIECPCGTFAIGHCHDCRRPVCGEHSEMSDRRLCGRCWQHAQEDMARRQHEEATTAAARVSEANAALARRRAARQASQEAADEAMKVANRQARADVPAVLAKLRHKAIRGPCASSFTGATRPSGEAGSADTHGCFMSRPACTRTLLRDRAMSRRTTT
jgi:hypothetical protein